MNKRVQDWNGDGAGTVTGTGVETRRRTPDGNGDGNVDESENSRGDGNWDEDNGNEDRTEEGGKEARKRKKPPNSCRHRAGKGGDLGGERRMSKIKSRFNSCELR